MIKHTFSISGNVPMYELHYSFPKNWDMMILKLQNSYMTTVSGSKKSFAETLRLLKRIAIELGFNHVAKLLVDGLCWAAVEMTELYILLLDKDITEIFSAALDAPLGIYHRKYGRCITNIKFSAELFMALSRRGMLDTSRDLSVLAPSLKYGLSSPMGTLRIFIRIPPKSVEQPTVVIRRLPFVPIRLDQLLEERQIDSWQVDLLHQAIQERLNIIIAGEPGSGKTTLANALLLEINPLWRIIILEDAREIKLPTSYSPFFARYSLPSASDPNAARMRMIEIAEQLHNSPDYLFAGELQTKDDTTTLFEGFAAGIRGMATTHARTPDGLIRRWISSHGLAKELLDEIDLICFTSRQMDNGKISLKLSQVLQKKAMSRIFINPITMEEFSYESSLPTQLISS